MERTPSAAANPPPRPLETLPSMLHAVMIQTANVFNSPQKQHPRAIMHTNALIRTSIPAAVDRFQYALDLLEMDILKAKAVLTRDLHKHLSAAETARLRVIEEESAALAREQAEKEEAERAIREKAENDKLEAERKIKEAEDEIERARLRKEKEEMDALDRQKLEEEERIRKELEESERAKQEEDQLAQAQLVSETQAEDRKAEGEEKQTEATTAAPEVIDLGGPSPPTTKDEPIVLDSSPSAPAANTFEDLDPSDQLDNIDLFGEDPLDDGEGNNVDSNDLDLEGMSGDIDIDLLFGSSMDDDQMGETTTGQDTTAGENENKNNEKTNNDNELTFDLDSDGKLDLMNIDLPSHLPGEGGNLNSADDLNFDLSVPSQPAQPEAMTSQPTEVADPWLADGSKTFDELMQSMNDNELMQDSADFNMFGEEFNNLYSNDDFGS